MGAGDRNRILGELALIGEAGGLGVESEREGDAEQRGQETKRELGFMAWMDGPGGCQDSHHL